MISSQEFRNKYEKFYDCMRMYLWPYDILEILADVEATIFSAFIDVPKLRLLLDKLEGQIKQNFEDDELLQKSFNNIKKLVEDKDEEIYLPLTRVKEVNPDEDKQIRIIKEEDNSEEQ